MRSGGGERVVSLVFLVALVIGGLLLARDLDPAYRTARASQEQAKATAAWARAEREQARAAAEAAEAPARARAVTVGLGLALVFGGLAGAAGLYRHTVNTTNRARRVEPTASGQFPLVRVSGPGWQGWLDPNRAPGHVTLLGDGPAVTIPLVLSEAGHVQLAQYAGGVAAITAATRHEGPGGRAALQAAAPMLLQPQTLAAPLPEVTEADPAHIDRLLALAGPEDDEVIDV